MDTPITPGSLPPQAEIPNPLPERVTILALNVQMVLSENKLIGEKIVTPRIVNQQTLDYDTFCDYLAQGSTVTAADVSAVMKQLEKNIPLILGLNTKIIASPDGLVFRPTVRGSITQSQLKAKLAQRKQEYLEAGDLAAAEKIDPNRSLDVSDLATSDLQACIVIDFPKKWDTRFQQSVTYKRVTKVSAAVEDSGDGNSTNSPSDNGGSSTQGGSQQSSTGTKYTITVQSNDSNMGTVSGGGQYEQGAQATLKAETKSGYLFDQWSDGSRNATRTITVTRNQTLIATFYKEGTTRPSEEDTELPPAE